MVRPYRAIQENQVDTEAGVNCAVFYVFDHAVLDVIL